MMVGENGFSQYKHKSNIIDVFKREIYVSNLPNADDIQLALLKAITIRGGEIKTKEAYADVKEQFPVFAEIYDNYHTPSEKVHWESKVKSIKSKLITMGCIDKNSSKGIWKITDKGKSYLREFSLMQSIVVHEPNREEIPKNLNLPENKYICCLSCGYKMLSTFFKCTKCNSVLNGEGVVSLSNGAKCTGKWKEGELIVGQVKIEYPSGDIYTGGYNGKFNGHGRIVWANGSILAGEFIDGNANGYCMFTHQNGSKKKVLFNNGNAVNEGSLRITEKNINKSPELFKGFKDLKLAFDCIIEGEPFVYLLKVILDFTDQKR